jgi:hypothetical protein
VGAPIRFSGTDALKRGRPTLRSLFFLPEAGSSSCRFQRESECSISELDSIGIITGEKNARKEDL